MIQSHFTHYLCIFNVKFDARVILKIKCGQASAWVSTLQAESARFFQKVCDQLGDWDSLHKCSGPERNHTASNSCRRTQSLKGIFCETVRVVTRACWWIDCCFSNRAPIKSVHNHFYWFNLLLIAFLSHHRKYTLSRHTNMLSLI